MRLLPILAKNQERTILFTQLTEQMDWGPRTANTYWGTLLTAMHLLQIHQTVDDQAMTSSLDKHAKTAPGWDLEDDTQVMSDDQVQLLATIADQREPSSHWRAAWVALAWGQRLGDVLKMEAPNVHQVNGRTTVSVTIGKTVGTTGAYSLSAQTTSTVAQYIWEAATHAREQATTTATPSLRLFTLDDREEHLWIPTMEKEIATTLKIDIRALRRSGLIRLAMAGAPLETLLTFSRHTTTKMLELYLQKGLFNESAAANQCKAVEASENAAMPSTRCAWPWRDAALH
jgi:hypothetical protein